MAQHVLLHSCLLLLDGLRAPGKGVCKCYNSSCSHHFPGTWITEMQCNIKTASKGKDAAATAVFFPSPEMDRNSHQVKYLPLPSPAAQSLPKNWSWSSEFASEACAAKHTQHRCCSPPCTSPSAAVRCQVWDPFTPQGSLEKAAICN